MPAYCMKIALLGYGKMGKAIEAVALMRGHETALKLDPSLPGPGGNLADADMAFEFSTPGSAYLNILRCFEAGVPVVVGTTGWLDKYAEVKGLCLSRGQAMFYASNFSIGMNLVFGLNRDLAVRMNRLPEYDVHIEETHHIRKLDSPSGTAITLAKDILQALDRKEHWVNKEAVIPAELSIRSHREGDVVGIHSVVYDSGYDRVELRHEAKSRDGFALGAVMAGEWLRGKKGFFGMDDLLK